MEDDAFGGFSKDDESVSSHDWHKVDSGVVWLPLNSRTPPPDLVLMSRQDTAHTPRGCEKVCYSHNEAYEGEQGGSHKGLNLAGEHREEEWLRDLAVVMGCTRVGFVRADRDLHGLNLLLVPKEEA